MQPSDRSKGPPKMTIGPLPTPPGGARPQTPPAAAKGAPAVGTGILSGSGLNFGPAYVPPRRQPALEGQPVLVTVPKPGPRLPPANAPLPMNGVLEAYAKGAKKPDVWPDAPTAKPTTPPKPVATPEPAPIPQIAEDPGPAPAWMAATAARARGANRIPLYVGGAALLAVAAFAAFTLLARRPSEPAPAPALAVIEQPAPAAAAAAPAPEPLRPQMEVATAEAPPTIRSEPAPKPAARPRKVQTAAAEPSPRPVAKEPAPPPVQVTPQPLAIAPPPAAEQQPPPRIIIPHVDPNSPIVTRSPVDQ